MHDKRKKIFKLSLEDQPDKKSNTAFLEYAKTSSNTYELYHTEVPDTFRGKGIAGLLAQRAFSELSQNGSHLILTCTYLHHYYNKHKTDYQDKQIELKGLS